MRNYEQIVEMTKNPGVHGTIVDSRPEAEYSKTDEKDPIKVLHIPTAVNLYFASLIDKNTGLLKSPEELKEGRVSSSYGRS